jgi:hypothetical protein
LVDATLQFRPFRSIDREPGIDQLDGGLYSSSEKWVICSILYRHMTKARLTSHSDVIVSYQVDWPGNTVQLITHPKNLWTDQGHTSNGVAGYGFFLGLIAMYVAWRQRHREGKVCYENRIT